MKIVINRCYGGFGLSAEAVLRLIEKDSPGIEKVKDGDGWYIVEGENGEPEQKECDCCMAQGYFEDEIEIDDPYM